MTLFSFLLRTSRGLAVMAILGGLVAGVCNSALIAFINTAVSRSAISSTSLIWGFVALCLLLPVTRFASSALLIKLSQKGINNLRMHLSERILAAPLRRLEEMGPARLYGALTEDVRMISFALVAIPALCIQMAIVVGCLSYLCWLSRPAFFGLLALMVIAVVSLQLPAMKARRVHRLARESQDALFKNLRALTDGNKELKLHAGRRQAFLVDSLGAASARHQRYNALGNMLDHLTGSWSQLIFFAAVGAVLFLMPRLVPMSHEVLMGYVLTMIYMMVPLDLIIGSFMPIVIRANISLRAIEALGISLAEVTSERPAAAAAAPSWRSLELCGITHTFHHEHESGGFVLGPIDLTLRPGELVFIIGGNGSGKTTLAKVLTGLYDAEAGEIRLDGQAVTDANRDAYRQHFSAVFSDFYLFDTILGIEAPELDAQAREYLLKLQLEGKVQISGGVLSTIDLSQGQRKRLALLTAYLENRVIYLFDEWAADQDPMFKQTFYYQLLPELKARGKTVLVISHDDHYYHLADRVIKLTNGQIELETTPQALLAGERSAVALSGLARSEPARSLVGGVTEEVAAQ